MLASTPYRPQYFDIVQAAYSVLMAIFVPQYLTPGSWRVCSFHFHCLIFKQSVALPFSLVHVEHINCTENIQIYVEPILYRTLIAQSDFKLDFFYCNCIQQKATLGITAVLDADCTDRINYQLATRKHKVKYKHKKAMR